MHNLKRWAFCLLLLGCNQERNKSIEAMNQGVEAGRQKLFERAISQLQQAISLDASNDQAYYNLGIIYKDQKKLAEAGDTAESEAVILEQMQQLMELTEKLEQAEAKGKEDALALEEKEEVIAEQMRQLMELGEKVEVLEKGATEWARKEKEFEALQKQLQDLLG